MYNIEIQNLGEWYENSLDIIAFCEKNKDLCDSGLKTTLDILEIKCKQHIVVLDLVARLYEKCPTAKFESALFFEGWNDEKILE